MNSRPTAAITKLGQSRRSGLAPTCGCSYRHKPPARSAPAFPQRRTSAPRRERSLLRAACREESATPTPTTSSRRRRTRSWRQAGQLGTCQLASLTFLSARVLPGDGWTVADRISRSAKSTRQPSSGLAAQSDGELAAGACRPGPGPRALTSDADLALRREPTVSAKRTLSGIESGARDGSAVPGPRSRAKPRVEGLSRRAGRRYSPRLKAWIGSFGALDAEVCRGGSVSVGDVRMRYSAGVRGADWAGPGSAEAPWRPGPAHDPHRARGFPDWLFTLSVVGWRVSPAVTLSCRRVRWWWWIVMMVVPLSLV